MADDEAKTSDEVAGKLLNVALSPAAQGFSEKMHETGAELGEAALIGAKTIKTLFRPLNAIVWGYERIENWLATTVSEKLSRVPTDKRIPPALLIAGPITEALRYSSEEAELRELFANLLVSAMDSRVSNQAHPAFVEIIKQLSPNEAKILKAYEAAVDKDEFCAVCNVRVSAKDGLGFDDIMSNVSMIGPLMGFDVKAVAVNIDNLARLELIRIEVGRRLTKDGVYDPMRSFPEVLAEKAKYEGQARMLDFEETFFFITSLGQQFIDTCVRERGR